MKFLLVFKSETNKPCSPLYIANEGLSHGKFP